MPSTEQLKQMQTKMREKGRFTKYCNDCGEIFGSDDMDSFLELMERHFETCEGKQNA